MTNLPAWAGADSVYRRLQDHAAAMGKREYEAHCQRKRRRARDRFQPSEELRDLCAAIGRGNEEELKGLLSLLRC